MVARTVQVTVMLATLALGLPQLATRDNGLNVSSNAMADIIKAANVKEWKPPDSADVVQWISLGDSYTAGIGSDGYPDSDHNSGYDCSRYFKAYSNQMNDNPAWSGDKSHRFHNAGACSGDVIEDVRKKQLTDDIDPSGHVRFKQPQFAMMTISGNDMGFSEIINTCVMNIWKHKDNKSCNEILGDAEKKMSSSEFQQDLSKLLLEITAKGQGAGGAHPPESFQVFINGYIQFWNHDDPGCDTVDWAWRTGNRYNKGDYDLTRPLRKRMNDLVDKLNDNIKNVSNALEKYGVVYIDGHQGHYAKHRFCEPGTDFKKPIGDDTWFWHDRSPWDMGDHWTSDQDSMDQEDLILQALISDKAALNAVKNNQLDAWQASPAFNDQASLYKALKDVSERNVTIQGSLVPLPEFYLRIFHPKGSGYKVQADNNVQAIIRARKAGATVVTTTSAPPPPPPPSQTPPPPPPPPAPPAKSDVCGTWYEFGQDHFEIYGKGKGFDVGPYGRTLLDHLRHCGVVSHWTWDALKNDPQGMEWKATGDLPIGTKSCVGSAVVDLGGSSPDGCTGAG